MRENQIESGADEKIDFAVEDLILHGRKIGEGKDGIVFFSDMSEIGDENKNVLSGYINDTDDVALKILKVYLPGIGMTEFNALKAAHKVLTETESAASVPKPVIIRNQATHGHTKDYLKAHGIKNDRVEIIFMEYITGADLTCLVYDFILRKNGVSDDDLKSMRFEEKHYKITELIEMEPVDTVVDARRKDAIFLRNERRLFVAARKIGFKIEEKMIAELENAVKAINDNGLFHNDIHPRNIMVNEEGKPFIIDFGRASLNEKKEDCPDDMAAIRRLREYFKPEDDLTKILLKDLEAVKSRVATTEKWRRSYLDFVQLLANDAEKALENCLASSLVSDYKFDIFLINLQTVIRDRNINPEIKRKVNIFISQKLKTGRAYLDNKINLIKQTSFFDAKNN